MMLFESLIFNLLPAAVGIMAVVLVFESCWRKCPPDKLMLVSGAGKMRSVSGKGTFVIPLLQRVDTLSLGAVQVQLTTENDIPTQDAILIHACAVANFQIGQTPELIETASKNYLNLDKEEMTRQVTEVMLGKMREVIGQMDLKELMRDRESFNAKVFGGSKDDLANLGLELRTFNVQDFSDSQGIIRSMGADQAAEIKKEAELAQIKAAEEVAIRQNQLDLKQADLKKQADKAKAEADMVKATVTAEKQRELYIAQQEAEIARLQGEQQDIGWGSQIRSYVFHPYTLVKDHRTNFEKGNVGAVMDGEIDEFINAWLKQQAAKQLAYNQQNK